MKLFAKFSILFLMCLLTFGCTIPTVYLGIPYTFDGHYRSESPVLDNDNFLYMRVANGGLTIYFGGDNLDNIQGLDYEDIRAIYITSLEENIYNIEAENIKGKITFNQNTTANISLSKNMVPTFSIENSVLNKINSF